LRYAPKGARQQRSKATMRSAQHLSFTVCTEGCETAEEQSEGKTKVIK